MPRYGDKMGRTYLVYCWMDRDSVCYCGHSFGRVQNGSWCPALAMSFHQAKRQHFEQRHPRRLSLGRIY